MEKYDQKLDAVGLTCPLPILRAKKMLSTMESGQIIYAITTDPGSEPDFKAYAKQVGELLEFKKENGQFHFLIRKG